MAIPFTLSPFSVSVFVNNRMYTLDDSHPGFLSVCEELRNPDPDEQEIIRLCDISNTINSTAQKFGINVEVRDFVVYYKGENIHNSLAERLIDLMSQGYDIKPWALFLDRIMSNPSFNSRKSLFDFLDHFKTPIMPDGRFLAFKRVRKDFMDIYSGNFDNSPGKIVTVPRQDVDDNINNTCSCGLHVAASVYLDNYRNAYDSKTVVVAVDPKDVVAVPPDYGFSKMRVSGYEVLREIDPVDIPEVEGKSMYHADDDYCAYEGEWAVHWNDYDDDHDGD